MTKHSYIARFTRTERAVHWVHASAFFVLLGSGLVLYLPRLSELVSRRPLVKAIHLYTALAWAIALVLVALVGNRRALRQTLRELEWWDGDDRRWILGRKAPQGRFNAGQKLNAALTAAFAVLFAISGMLLWLGERDTRFRWQGTIIVHDALMYVWSRRRAAASRRRAFHAGAALATTLLSWHAFASRDRSGRSRPLGRQSSRSRRRCSFRSS